uniref:non-specific serine/threonine protein kinase n=2 Tax=Denticeps clupeoides TaxID=299321 RepID=A0AAY4CHT4_9TELE
MKREARIHQMIRHPNVVLLLETLETENSFYLVVELCAGGDLMERICDRKRLDEREVRRFTRQILSAVEHLHRHGIVHRDLKIENFLLDEHNNIKIVDFGLSNTLKTDALALDLLNTQCGSPAYAAPELLAHKKYGPKVDVWSVGVSTFAMLTGTLPFTVEPFNIKQLHQKMVNGEMSAIPSDISKGAVQFVLSLLEADPAKRPSVKEAMEDKWLNEGYAKKPLSALSYKNRLRPEELNSSVLNDMAELLGFAVSDAIHAVINNKPSAAMATYHLLLKKLRSHQKGTKGMRKGESGEWGVANRLVWREKTSSSMKNHQQKEAGNDRSTRQSGKTQRNQSEDRVSQSSRKAVREMQPSASASPSHPSADGITDEEIGISLETRDTLFPEVSPPKCSCREGSGSKLCDSTPCETSITVETTKDHSLLSIKPPRPHELHPSRTDHTPAVETPPHEKLEKLQTFYMERGAMTSPREHLDSRAGQQFKDVLLAIKEKTTPPARHFSDMETTAGSGNSTQGSPLPRLRRAGTLKETTSK